MSTKNNVFVGEALAVMGSSLSLDDGALTRFCEGQIDGMQRLMEPVAVEVGERKKMVVFVTYPDWEDVPQTAIYCDKSGAVKLFSNAGAVMAALKKTSVSDSDAIQFFKKTKVATLGDPVASLKSKYKKIKAELLSAEASKAAMTAKVASAAALGWEIAAAGTQEKIEFIDLQKRAQAVEDWRQNIEMLRNALQTSLTSAGIDPATVV